MVSETVPLSTDEAHQVLVDARFPPAGTIDQAAEVTGLSVATLRRRYREGDLRALHSAGARGGRILILRRDLARLLAAMSS